MPPAPAPRKPGALVVLWWTRPRTIAAREEGITEHAEVIDLDNKNLIRATVLAGMRRGASEALVYFQGTYYSTEREGSGYSEFQVADSSHHLTYYLHFT